MKKGDLVYVPAETRLLQYNKEVKDVDPEKTYIGPTPIKFNRLTKPLNLLLIEENAGNECVKVWYQGEEWFVEKKNIKT